MIIRPATLTDLQFILNQFNEAILHTTAVYEYEPFTQEYINQWYQEKTTSGFPVIVAENEGILKGFASYGTFRQRCAYKTTVEHSVYVASEFQGMGIGKMLLLELIQIASKQGIHVMIGGIDAENQHSIDFHKSLGFEECGHIKEVAFKFGRWLDLVFVQKLI